MANRTRTPSPCRNSRRRGEDQTTDDSDDDDDDDDMDAGMSLAAMEAELKPRVLETFRPTSPPTTRSCASCRTRTSSSTPRGRGTSRASQIKRAYKKLREEIITDVKSLSLNNNRIESLVEQLYAINKR